ncbi:hypothetical protein [Methanosphaerula subterraneus]
MLAPIQIFVCVNGMDIAVSWNWNETMKPVLMMYRIMPDEN